MNKFLWGVSDTFEANVEALADIGLNSQLIVLDWNALQPTAQIYDQQLIDRYAERLEKLRKHNMTGILSLHHGSDPAWFSRQGGWEKPEAVGVYMQYAQKLQRSLGDAVSMWLTFSHLPEVSRKARKMRQRAHDVVYRVLHRDLPHAQVGAIQSLTPQKSDLEVWHHALPSHQLPHNILGAASSRDSALADRLFERTPAHLPLYIIATMQSNGDAQQAALIRDHLRTIEDAQKRGVDVRGYVRANDFSTLSDLDKEVFRAITKIAA